MQLFRRAATTGLAVMAGVALTTTIWPGIASLVAGLLATALGAGAAVPVVAAARRIRTELAWRRQLRCISAISSAPYAVPAPGLAPLQESA